MSHSDKLQLFYQLSFLCSGHLSASWRATWSRTWSKWWAVAAMIWVTEAAEQNKEYHCESKTVETVSHSSMSKKQIGEAALLWFDYSLSQKCIYSRLVTILGFQTWYQYPRKYLIFDIIFNTTGKILTPSSNSEVLSQKRCLVNFQVRFNKVNI